ncbi:hypothetical protein PQI07_33265 [Methylobacterium sp. 092160098-2]|jgi:hypothetical protein|uniref:Protein of unassigned function n=2 Tax=Methylobacterium TaxID=407 RepID=A0A089NMC3_9HYPH|nr:MULTISPECIES: hypothetical protein [Methylobacterium]AIQ89046.1 protein of unassigned function [Methylobacterium oryzae CBMB20]MBP30207.1 hypothetical protein [Methylobacterium sp.]MDE4915450.1 hypothetical protein [Methylobacterium sp. 092160098-2]WFS09001.1 hypothetical protein P9K36_06805 [Methylobacterium sp. 391_Methyba4]
MMITKLAASLLLAAGCAALAAPSYAQPAAFGGPKMLVHGNYCGPGNNAPLPPIDALDAACARHDACTPNGGLPSQACNLRLQREATLISRDPRQPQDVRSMAGLVAASATLIPTDPNARSVPASVSTNATQDAYAPALDRSAPAGLEDDADDSDAD